MRLGCAAHVFVLLMQARLKAYTDRDKTFDSRMVLSDGALKAR